MPDWRRKLTIDWPCALGDFLWALLVVQPAEWLNAFTFKRAMILAGVILIVIAAAQTLPLDVAIIFAGDTMTYLEVASAVMLFAARGRIVTSFRISMTMLRRAARRAIAATRLAFRRVPRRHLKRLLQEPGERSNDPDGGPALAMAFG